MRTSKKSGNKHKSKTIRVKRHRTGNGISRRAKIQNNKRLGIFVVHGHDEAMRETVARYLEKMGLIPVVLHEQTNNGDTIIEKFEHYSGVKMALILLSPDDMGGKSGSTFVPRARQNVVLEWGYFMGKLARNRVIALKKGDIELPSDTLGIVWETFDEHGGWKMKVAGELQEAGYKIDFSKLPHS